jgi:hypothetical protein
MRGKGDSCSFIDLLVTPNLRTSTIKALQHIQYNIDAYDTLLLNFPEEMEGKIGELATEQISLRKFLEYVENNELIPHPITSWVYTAKPILEVLHRLSPYIKIYCYGSSEMEASSMDVSIAFAQLTLRTIITNKVYHDSWRKTAAQSLQINSERLHKDSKRILSKTDRASTCITGMSPSRLRKNLEESGASVRVIYVEKPYHFTPLTILERKMMLGPLSDREIEELVLAHVDYVRNYVYLFRNRDRAHYEWSLDKVPWPKLGMERREVSLLDNLISEP